MIEDIENHRPIAILNCLPKLFNKMVTRKLKPIFKGILVDEHHGFRSGNSTSTNLALFNNCIFSNLDNKLQVDVIYTDFCLTRPSIELITICFWRNLDC